MNPPLPSDRGLKYNWNGNPIPFYDNVTYSCEKSNMFFENDRNIKTFTVECLNDGSFAEPFRLDDWPLCVDSKSFLLKGVCKKVIKLVLLVPIVTELRKCQDSQHNLY